MRAHCRPHTPATRVLRDFVDSENAGENIIKRKDDKNGKNSKFSSRSYKT